jgi:hypothetical protein
VVFGRRGRGALSRFVSGFSKASLTPGSDERQWLGHAGGRNNRGTGTLRHPARNDSALCTLSEWQTKKLLESSRRTPLTDARRSADLSLDQLNEATQAWIEMEYNRAVHSELGEAPVQRYLHHRDVGRPCPSSAELKIAFTTHLDRTQRRSDGTLSLKGIRFEIPSRYNHFQRLSVRAAFWDLSHVYLAEPKTGAILCRLFPLDKHKNAQGQRAAKGSPIDKPAATGSPTASGMAPLLQKLIQQYATTGLPPAYLPKH